MTIRNATYNSGLKRIPVMVHFAMSTSFCQHFTRPGSKLETFEPKSCTLTICLQHINRTFVFLFLCYCVNFSRELVCKLSPCSRRNSLSDLTPHPARHTERWRCLLLTVRPKHRRLGYFQQLVWILRHRGQNLSRWELLLFTSYYVNSSDIQGNEMTVKNYAL